MREDITAILLASAGFFILFFKLKRICDWEVAHFVSFKTNRMQKVAFFIVRLWPWSLYLYNLSKEEHDFFPYVKLKELKIKLVSIFS